jgi:hypothetical protein
VAIVASGPSASQVNVDLLRDRAKVIAINSSWKLVPWADALYGSDYRWWYSVKGCPDFAGIKMSVDCRASETKEWKIRHLRCAKVDDALEIKRIGTVGWGGNSGFNAFNFAIQLRPSLIILIGFDVTVEKGTHWHGNHDKPLGNPRTHQMERWRRAMDRPAKIIAELGIRVVNCSPVSKIKSYPIMSLEEALK